MALGTTGTIPIILPTLAMKEGNQGNQAKKPATSTIHYDFEVEGCKKEIRTMSTLEGKKYAQFASQDDD